MSTVRDLIKMLDALVIADCLDLLLGKHHSDLYQQLEEYGYRFRYCQWIFNSELSSTH